MGAEPRIVLWQIDISHYSEKARWTLDCKSLQYERRAPPPGLHIAIAAWLTRGRAPTLPIMDLDGDRIAGSTAIIEALERRFPEPALLPGDAAERRRVLELCRWFDRELGPFSRRLAFFELGREPQRIAPLAAQAAPALAARMGPLMVPYTRAFTALRYGAASGRAAASARAKVLAALDHLEAELGGSDYLVGSRFTAADITAACLFVPVALPPQASVEVDGLPEPYERFRAALSQRRGYRWVLEMFARHRRTPSADASGSRPAPAGRSTAS